MSHKFTRRDFLHITAGALAGALSVAGVGTFLWPFVDQMNPSIDVTSIDVTNTAILVVDIQNDFCPGGSLAVSGGDRVVSLVNKLKRRFDLCIFTQDWHPAGHMSFASSHKKAQPFDTINMPYGVQVLWPDHCVQGTEGAKFHSDLEIADTDLVLQKGIHRNVDSYSGFFENDRVTRPRFANGQTLTELLVSRGIKIVVCCGLAYDFCVGWHALDARKESFQAIVVKDATRSIAMPGPDGSTSETAMDKMLSDAGVYITDAASLNGLLRHAKQKTEYT